MAGGGELLLAAGCRGGRGERMGTQEGSETWHRHIGDEDGRRTSGERERGVRQWGERQGRRGSGK
jgi:hypothetical protein